MQILVLVFPLIISLFSYILSSCPVYMSWSSIQLNTKKGIFKAIQRLSLGQLSPCQYYTSSCFNLPKSPFHNSCRLLNFAYVCPSCATIRKSYGKDEKCWIHVLFLNLSQGLASGVLDIQSDNITAYIMSIKKCFFRLKGILLFRF